MAQIQKGDTFVDGQQVTGARLNQLIDSATILPNIITDQVNLTANTIATDDSILIYDLSATALREASASDLLNSNLSITTSSISSGANSDINIISYDGTTINSLNYVGTTTSNTVTSNSHGLTVGQTVLISNATGSQYNGTYVIASTTSNTFTYNILTNLGNGTFSSSNGILVTVTTSTSHNLVSGQSVLISTSVPEYNGTFSIVSTGTNTFTYSLSSAQTASSGSLTYSATTVPANSGTLSYIKKATIKNSSNESILNNLYVGNQLYVTGSTYQNGTVTQNGTVNMAGTVNTSGTVNMGGTVNMAGTVNITATPTLSSQAVNKGYVDGTVSKTANGYCKLANGLIIQWGTSTNQGSGNTNFTETFPLEFPNSCLSVTLGQKTTGTGGTNVTAVLVSFTKTNFVWDADNVEAGTTSIYATFIAIGY